MTRRQHRQRLPGLTGDAAAASGTGWLVLRADNVQAPSLAEVRACARPAAKSADACAPVQTETVRNPESCALMLQPELRFVAGERALPPGGIPRPPLLAVDDDGCIVAAWSVATGGWSLVPVGSTAIEVRLRGARQAVMDLEQPLRDAAFMGNSANAIAVATATAVHVFDRSGAPATPPRLAADFGSIVGLGVTAAGTLVVIDESPPDADNQVRLFERSGVEVPAPATFANAGWFAQRRNAGLTFEDSSCRFRVDPGRVTTGCCAQAARDMTTGEACYYELVAELSALRARRGHATRGSVILGPANTEPFVEQALDGQRPDTRWNRVTLFGSIPPRCSVQLQTKASNDLADGDPLVTVGWSTAVTLGPGARVAVAAPGDTRSACGDAWVLAPPGRYLWIRLVLRGDSLATPRIDSIEVERERASIGRFLPQFFRESTPDDRFLGRWLALFETTAFDGLAQRLDDYAELFDPRTAPENMLPYLAAWLDLPTPARILADTPRLRRILVNAPDIARRRGTLDGLILIIWLYTDVRVQVRESFVTASRFILGGDLAGPVLGCDTALTAECPPTYLGDSRLGCSNLLECDERSGTLPFFFEVLAPAEALCQSEMRALIELLIDSEKPAHTRHCLRAVAPAGWVLGVASVVGQHISDDFDRRARDKDTYGIAIGNGPPRPAPIGEGFALGHDSRLAVEAGQSAMRVPASVGQTTRVQRPHIDET